jgi:FlaA1/EpsC-like NDP-sugar epimerase
VQAIRRLPGLSALPLVLLDIAAVCGSYAGALLLRFDGEVSGASWEAYWKIAPAVAAAYVAANLLFGVYHAAWKYGGIRDLFSLGLAVTLVTVGVTAFNALGSVFPRKDLPLSVNLISGGLIFMTMASTKLWPHLNAVQFNVINRGGDAGKRVLIVGAGDSGQLVAREFLHNPHWGLRPVCFVDDDARKIGVRIHGIPVAGDRYQIPHLAEKYRASEIVLAMPTISRKSFEEIMALCRQAQLSVNIVPSAVEILSGKVDRAVTARFRG